MTSPCIDWGFKFSSSISQFVENFDFFKNEQTPASFIIYFRSFQTNSTTILQQIPCEKCPFSIQCQDLNPWLLEHESPPITTRPGLPPIKFDIFATIDVELRLTIFNKGPNWYLAFSSPVSKLAILPTNMPMLVQQILNQTFVYSCQKVFLFL